MKRSFILLCIAAALTACQKDGNWTDPTQGEDAALFGLSDMELDSMTFSLEDIEDPGEINTPYQFFSQISFDEWAHLQGTERFDAIEVPQETLKKMTTLALIKTAINYPSMVEYAVAYNYPLAAMTSLTGKSALFKELASRKNAEDLLIWVFGKVAIDLQFITDPETAIKNKDYEALMELNELDFGSYEAFFILVACDCFDFSQSPYLDYFKAAVAHKIAEKGLDLSGNTTYFFEPLLVIWDKYFGNLAPDICLAAHPYVF